MYMRQRNARVFLVLFLHVCLFFYAILHMEMVENLYRETGNSEYLHQARGRIRIGRFVGTF